MLVVAYTKDCQLCTGYYRICPYKLMMTSKITGPPRYSLRTRALELE